MKKQNPQSIKTFPESPNFKNQDSDPFFSDKGINNISPSQRETLQKGKIDRHSLLKIIKENAPLTAYRLSKITNLPYNTVWQICRELEFAQLIEYKTVLGEYNRTQKLICIPLGRFVSTREGENGK